MTELGKILSGVFQRTTEGKLNWSRAVEKDRFIASAGAISIVIVEEHDNWAGTTHHLNIIDESGETVETLGDHDTTAEQHRQLQQIYVLARRSALDVDSTLEKLANALEL